MGRKGKRYSNENKLNYTKIFAVLIFFIVFAMMILGIKKLLTTKTSPTGRISTISYFPVYTNKKWGVIDSTGEIVITPQYEEMIIIPNKTKAYFICTYDVDYENNEYKTKVINEKNETIIDGYDKVNFLDTIKNSEIIYLDDILKVEKDGKKGLISLNGSKILNCDYEEISILQGIENSFLIKKNGLVGVCDYEGNIIIEPKYKDIQGIGGSYKNGYITISTDNLYGITDFNSSIIFENKYLDIKNIYSSNKYAVKKEDKYIIIDKSEKNVLDMLFDDVVDINNNEIMYIKDKKYGVINTEGQIVIEPTYEELKFLDNGLYIAKKDNKYGLINSNNENEIEFKYMDIEYISLAGIIIGKLDNNEYELYDKTSMSMKLKVNSIDVKDKYIIVTMNGQTKYFNFKFEEKDAKSILINNTLFGAKKGDKYGFIDSDSNVIVDYKYDNITEFNEYGFAGIKLNGLWGVIGLDGKEVIAPKYNLENNKSINFIGKWHIGIDGTYYTDL